MIIRLLNLKCSYNKAYEDWKTSIKTTSIMNDFKALLARTIFLSLIFCFEITIDAQVQFEPISCIEVQKDGLPLEMPWLGGFNSPQFNAIDFDGDGFKDLHIFDYSLFLDRGKNLTFLNTQAEGEVFPYVYAPEFESLFDDFVIFINAQDYDCDGIEDLFVGKKNNVTSNTDLFVYKGSRNENGFWSTDVFKKLTEVELKFGYVPAFADVDFDGAIDILALNAEDNFVNFYRNVGQEEYGTCDSILFNLETCWGDFEKQIGLEFEFGIACKGGKPIGNENLLKQVHSVSIVSAFDHNNDQDIDLLFSNSLSDRIVFLENVGDNQSPMFTSAVNNYPVNAPVVQSSSTYLYQLDLNNDGIKEHVFAPFNPDIQSYNRNNVLVCEQDDDWEPVLDHPLNSFQIDVGDLAKPMLYDYNKDGLVDLLVARGSAVDSSGTLNGGIAYYQNVGTDTLPAFEFVTDTLINFQQYITLESDNDFAFTFGDLNGDGKDDLVVSTFFSSTRLMYLENVSESMENPEYELVSSELVEENLQGRSIPQLVDVNKDGLLDLLVGQVNGGIVYYENAGNEQEAHFVLTNSFFGEINANTTGIGIFGFAAPHLVDIDRDDEYELLLGNVDGYLFLYEDIDANIYEGAFTLVDSFLVDDSFRSRSIISTADLNNDNSLELAVGNFQGGVFLYSQSSQMPLCQLAMTGIEEISLTTEQEIKVYPNPANETVFIEGLSENEMFSISVFNTLGQLVLEESDGDNRLNIERLMKGVYFLKIKTTKGQEYKEGHYIKFVKQ